MALYVLYPDRKDTARKKLKERVNVSRGSGCFQFEFMIDPFPTQEGDATIS